MTDKAAKLLEEALQLSTEDRDEIAIELQESLEPKDDPAEVEASWAEEIKRRIEDHEQGRAETVPWEEVQRKLKEEINAAADDD